MSRIVQYFIVIGVLLAACHVANADEMPQHDNDSTSLELLASSGTVLTKPVLPLRKALINPLDITLMDRVTTRSTRLLWELSTESRVESDEDSPTYWRILAPILITAAVGTATWMLFTIRSS